MKGIIIKMSEVYGLNINQIFDVIHDVKNEYNWLITGIDVVPLRQGYNILSKVDYIWVSGKELTEMTNDLIWWFAVFSGFPKNISKEEALSYKFPYADGYPGFWHNPVSIQHPLADIEIVPWDATFYLVISKNDKVIEDFTAVYTSAEDLEVHNNHARE